MPIHHPVIAWFPFQEHLCYNHVPSSWVWMWDDVSTWCLSEPTAEKSKKVAQYMWVWAPYHPVCQPTEHDSQLLMSPPLAQCHPGTLSSSACIPAWRGQSTSQVRTWCVPMIVWSYSGQTRPAMQDTAWRSGSCSGLNNCLNRGVGWLLRSCENGEASVYCFISEVIDLHVFFPIKVEAHLP